MNLRFDAGEALRSAGPESKGGGSTLGAQAVGVLHAPARPQIEVQAQAVTRFDIHQRIQHILLMSSFIVLALTGLPQKFSGLALSQWFILSLGGFHVVQTIHKVAAFVMVFDGLYHLAYLGHTLFVRRLLSPFRMIPTFQDVLDFFHAIRYFLGLEKERPRFDRFSYLQKFDYWAVFWGIAIMGGSGFILMFPDLVSKILPGNIIMLALIAHSDEAVLAVGWIAVVHIFYVHIVPSVFPINPAIFTGRMPRHLYAEEHPLEYARIQVIGPQLELEDRRAEIAGIGSATGEAVEGMEPLRAPHHAKPIVPAVSTEAQEQSPLERDDLNTESMASTGEAPSTEMGRRVSGDGKGPSEPIGEDRKGQEG